MAKLTIDGREIDVPAGATVLQACELAGVEIPRFCYHTRLSIAGNCRMCLVEMEKAPKPIASCAMPAADNMVILTDTPMVRRARRGVMEFLLINHPLDCPICDQGGECDLQDQAMAFGYDRSRYLENKRAVPDKNLGPLIKTFMNRCIHCTRCIRFATEVAGVPELGATGRGEHMEVGTYVARALTSELSGNLVDLCPVGALTSKPYAFSARSWELKPTESIDVHDAVGSNVRIDAQGARIARVLPRTNDAINEEWISDKTRHACDGLARRRLDRPYVRRDGVLQPASWAEAFTAIAERLRATDPARIAALVGDLADCEAVMALGDLLDALGVPHRDCREPGAYSAPAAPASWRFNTTIAGIEQADAILIAGCNPRWEAALVNARIRKRYTISRLPIGVIGPALELTYPVSRLGDDLALLGALAAGQGAFFERLAQAERPLLILGSGALARPDGAAVLGAARRLAEATGMVADGWNGFNVLQRAAARVGALELGFVPAAGGLDTAGILAGAAAGSIDVIYALGTDEIEPAQFGRAFVIYQGHHGDRGAARADVVLPGAAYTEKNATYVNLEGRAQHTHLAVLPPGEAREDWKIIRALSEVTGHRLPYDNLSQLRGKLRDRAACFAAIGQVVPAPWTSFGTDGPIAAGPVALPIADFYRTDPIARASATMKSCSDLLVKGLVPDDAQERPGVYG